jgi:hypothetical protein
MPDKDEVDGSSPSGPIPGAEEESMGEGKKRGKIKKFFLFAFFAGLIGALVSFFKRRRAGSEENEWQELPPPQS